LQEWHVAPLVVGLAANEWGDFMAETTAGLQEDGRGMRLATTTRRRRLRAAGQLPSRRA